MAEESKLEKKLREYAEGKGCMFLKFVSPGRKGVPDRIVFGPNGRVVLLELKARTGSLSPAQTQMIIALRDLDHAVAVVQSLEQGKSIIDTLTRGLL